MCRNGSQVGIYETTTYIHFCTRPLLPWQSPRQTCLLKPPWIWPTPYEPTALLPPVLTAWKNGNRDATVHSKMVLVSHDEASQVSKGARCLCVSQCVSGDGGTIAEAKGPWTAPQCCSEGYFRRWVTMSITDTLFGRRWARYIGYAKRRPTSHK